MFAANALAPTPTLSEPVVVFANAALPTAVLWFAVVVSDKAC